jgi:large subunit ribosomal protein L21
VKTRLAVIWAALTAAAVTGLGILTGRRRRRRAERQKARNERRRKRAQRKGQGGRKRAAAAARTASVASTAATSAKSPAGSKAPEGSSESAPAAEKSTSGGAARSEDGDDLQAIKGLGAVAETKLKDAGVTTYDQIAAWTPDEVQDIAARLSLQAGRITSDDWVGQARTLVEERAAGS